MIYASEYEPYNKKSNENTIPKTRTETIEEEVRMKFKLAEEVKKKDKDKDKDKRQKEEKDKRKKAQELKKYKAKEYRFFSKKLNRLRWSNNLKVLTLKDFQYHYYEFDKEIYRKREIFQSFKDSLLERLLSSLNLKNNTTILMSNSEINAKIDVIVKKIFTKLEQSEIDIISQQFNSANFKKNFYTYIINQ